MGDLISRSVLLEHMDEIYDKKVRTPDMAEAFCEIAELISTVEAEPVVHGERIEKEDAMVDTYYDCSVCGESFTTIDGTPSDNLFNYCPNCGAKMDVEV